MTQHLTLGQKMALLWRAFTDERTPAIAKVLVVIALLYGVSPIDVLPDFLPLIGLTDDALLIVIAIVTFLRMTKDMRRQWARTVDAHIVDPQEGNRP